VVTRKWSLRRKQMSKSDHFHGNNLNQIGTSGAENRENALDNIFNTGNI